MPSTRAVAYMRVSTTKQADEGVSLEAQRAKLIAYAALYDVVLVEVIVDAGVSAKTLDRPGLAKALGMIRSGRADALLVVKLDRLTRSVRDLGQLVADYFACGRAALLCTPCVSRVLSRRTAMPHGGGHADEKGRGAMGRACFGVGVERVYSGGLRERARRRGVDVALVEDGAREASA